ncbi:MAG: hypothetical protein ACK5MG_06585 [Bacteroidales bacterium]
MMTVFLASIVVVAFAFVGLGITMILKKGGKFPSGHVHDNEYLRKNGVVCIKTWDKEQQQPQVNCGLSDAKEASPECVGCEFMK